MSGEDYGFIYPNATNPSDENLVLELGQMIDIKWNSPFTAIKLAFIAENGPVFQFFSRESTCSAGSLGVLSDTFQNIANSCYQKTTLETATHGR